MRRLLLQILGVAILCGWVGAQGKAVNLTAGERLHLLKRNRTMIADLVKHGVNLSQRNSDLDRAEETLATAQRLSRAYQDALFLGDVPRVLEVSDLLGEVVANGFVPNLKEAQRLVRPGSPDYERYQQLHTTGHQQLSNLADAFPQTGPAWEYPEVQAGRKTLHERLNSIPLPTTR